MILRGFEVVIGLEVHAQLSTDSKIFATSSSAAGRSPNTQTDPVTLGLPGALPVLNRSVVDSAIKLGLATQCKIERESILSRKHYLYPDLPKGYQISQYDKPICLAGKLQIKVEGGRREIGITRIHIEEDAGKNIHLDSDASSVVDLNRAGVPLLEIVSEPEITGPEEAGSYMRTLRQMVRYLDVCDGNMEEGSLRCDANVSVRPVGQKEFGTKVEIKNLNSFKFVERALYHEIERQVSLIEQGEKIVQETRLWDEVTGTTRSMRTKEFAEDYRYFPDPDLLPLVVDEEWISRMREQLPELPKQAAERLSRLYGLDEYLCELLTEERLLVNYYDAAVATHNSPLSIANWITSELFGKLNRESLSISACPISPENLAQLVRLIDTDVISGKIAKNVFDQMFATGVSAQSVVDSQGLKQLSDPEQIRAVVLAIIKRNPTQHQEFKAGKTKMFGFFVGQVMKETDGKANPKLVNDLLTEELAK